MIYSRYNRRIVASHIREGCNLSQICSDLGARTSSSDTSAHAPPSLVTQEAVSLLTCLLNLDHEQRITASGALQHSFLAGVPH